MFFLGARKVLPLTLFFLTSLYQSATSTPWESGEQLVYEIKWGMIIAAEAHFTAIEAGNAHYFKMHLRSRGLVNSLHPIDSKFYSQQQKNPWSSLHFKVDREENGKRKKQTVVIDCSKKSGTFQDHLDGRNKSFELPQATINDILSGMYSTRRINWETTKKTELVVYERYKIKKASAKLVRTETVKLGDWSEQEYWVIEVRELPEKDAEGKTKKKDLWTQVWITKDEKQTPHQARLKFKYGTFTIMLKKKDKSGDAQKLIKEFRETHEDIG